MERNIPAKIFLDNSIIILTLYKKLKYSKKTGVLALHLLAVMVISESSCGVRDQATHEIIPGGKSLKPEKFT